VSGSQINPNLSAAPGRGYQEASATYMRETFRKEPAGDPTGLSKRDVSREMSDEFLDEAKVYIRSGDGGNGCVSFRREKFIEQCRIGKGARTDGLHSQRADACGRRAQALSARRRESPMTGNGLRGQRRATVRARAPRLYQAHSTHPSLSIILRRRAIASLAEAAGFEPPHQKIELASLFCHATYVQLGASLRKRIRYKYLMRHDVFFGGLVRPLSGGERVGLRGIGSIERP
jgi:hypothetical protein